VPAILLLIMLGAFAVRFYNYDTWLYFKMDQSRDAFTVANAVKNGPGDLPLLGPRAGATKVSIGFLHLGPIFYYFQYLSGVIFHSTTPQVFAYPDLFFSIAVLPLLYVFLRLYFSRLNSLLIVAMYAFSFLVIEYSRFAWNPNSLPFFTILSFYGLLKFLHEPEEKKRKWWLILWAIGLTVGSQLHFLGFFSLVGISALLFFFHYELWKKENIQNVFKEKNFQTVAAYAGIALLVVFIFYSPVIISDSMKNWANTKDFFQAFSTKQGTKPLTTRAVIGIQSQIEYYVMIFTSYIITKGSNNTYGSLLSLLVVALFAGGSYLMYKSFRETKDNLRKDFLLLIFLWFFIFLLITIPVATQIEPRYFIFTFAVPFIFLGIFFEFLERKLTKEYAWATVAITAVILLANASGTSAWFTEQAKSQKEHLTVHRTLILKTKDGVTLGQLQRAADYIYQNRVPGDRVYFYVKPEHVRPLSYLFSEKNDKSFDYYSFKLNDDPSAQYFIILPSDYAESEVAAKVKISQPMNVVSMQKFGQLAVWQVTFPGRIVSSSFKAKAKSSNTESDRVYWKNVL
jgi:hypothetical protein